jgi:hypothetical protein
MVSASDISAKRIFILWPNEIKVTDRDRELMVEWQEAHRFLPSGLLLL